MSEKARDAVKPRLVHTHEGPEHHTHHCNENGAYRTAANPSKAGWYTTDGRPFPEELLATRFVCRECGARGIDHRVQAQEMADHINGHGLSVEQYAARWHQQPETVDIPRFREDYT